MFNSIVIIHDKKGGENMVGYRDPAGYRKWRFDSRLKSERAIDCRMVFYLFKFSDFDHGVIVM